MKIIIKNRLKTIVRPVVKPVLKTALKTLINTTAFLLTVFSFVSVSVADEAASNSQIVGDADRGRLPFFGCQTCHYPYREMGHNTGPNLYGIFGRKAGSYEDFAYYSDVLKQADFIWTPEILDLWLRDSTKMLPGTTMMAVPIADAQKRADLIEYMKQYQD